MRRLRPVVVPALAVLVLLVTTLTAQQTQPAAKPRRIAVFGSSVANGTGDELRKEGYTGRLRELLAPAGWEVLNQSRGGDTTVRIAPRFAPEGTPDPKIKYLLPVDPTYVLIGLSLGNEGLQSARTPEAKEAVFKQFAQGMLDLIARSRQHGIVPIMSLCYTRNNSTALDYEYTRRTNLLMNTWDVPSANFLGAVDDGTGKWADGFWNDSLHPTAAGHSELVTTFVPSLFEAVEKGKPIPTRSTATGFARVTSPTAPLAFAPEATMHPFALSLAVRTQSDGTIATINGAVLNATTVASPVAGRNGAPPTDRRITTLSAGQRFAAAIGVKNGVWTYTPSSGAAIVSATKADGAWHQIVLSHYTARGETLFFVDGMLAGTTTERLQPTRFALGGPDASSTTLAPAPTQADYKDALIYRAALNADEVVALQKGTLLQASLEVYAPLTDSRFAKGVVVENRAQSLTALTVEGGSIAHVER